MDERVTLPQRLLEVLEALLAIPTGNLKSTLTHVADLIAEVTASDKVDAFLYDPGRDSLVAVGSSIQPLSTLQHQLGLNVLQLSNGGRTVNVYKAGETFVTGALQDDPEELRGVKEGLKIRSQIGVPLAVGGQRRGMLMLASLKPDYYTAEDVRFVESVAHWVSIVTHRAELAEETLRQAAAQARRAAAGEIVGVLAHDLRNLLSPLATRVELMRETAKRAGRPDELQDAEAARRTVRRLDDMVQDMLDAARIEQGALAMQAARVDLGALVTEAAKALQTATHPLLVKVQEGEPVVVVGDEARLRQCVENLMANAQLVSPDSAAVSVFCTADRRGAQPSWARVEVIDQGPAVEPDGQGRRRGGAPGIGLYLARQIARAHGGDLVAESGPERGARFVLTVRRS